MLDILNIFFLAGTLLSNIVLYSDGDYPFPENRESVVTVSTHREWWRVDGNGKCKYTGVMVPFVRDWEQEITRGKDGKTILPPEPDKTAGQAFIINQKVCGDKVEPIFRVAEIWAPKGTLMEKHQFAAFDVIEMRPDQCPKWLEQVLHRIDRVATHEQGAKTFLLALKSASLKLPEDLDTLVHQLGEKPVLQQSAASTAPALPETP